jgi:exodeoxyribonuclease VII small subunit
VSTDHPLSFEDALAELESLVDTLEHGDLPVDDALKRFDHGLANARKFQEDFSKAGYQVSRIEDNHSDPSSSMVNTVDLDD